MNLHMLNAVKGGLADSFASAMFIHFIVLPLFLSVFQNLESALHLSNPLLVEVSQ